MKRRLYGLAAGFIFCLGLASDPVQAAPIVTFTTSGTSGNYVLDFCVTNTLGVDNLDIYYFGVEVSDGSVSGTPTANWSEWGTFSNNSTYGGPDIDANATWFTDVQAGDAIGNGETLSGFALRVTSTGAPTTVRWFAFAYDGLNNAEYGGTDNFWSNVNPGFVGVAGSNAVPEPTTMLLLGSGLLGMILLRRRRKA